MCNTCAPIHRIFFQNAAIYASRIPPSSFSATSLAKVLPVSFVPGMQLRATAIIGERFNAAARTVLITVLINCSHKLFASAIKVLLNALDLGITGTRR